MASELDRLRTELARAKANADYYKQAFQHLVRWKARLEVAIDVLEQAKSSGPVEAAIDALTSTRDAVADEERRVAATMRLPSDRLG